MAKKVKRVSIAAQYRKRSQFAEFCRRMGQNKGAVIGFVVVAVIVALAIFADAIFDYETQIAGYDLTQCLQAPSRDHPFGTDELGRDLFARVLYGAKYSIAIGASAVAFSVIIGVPVGALCGYFGGYVDMLVMRVFDILRSIPGLLMGIVIVSAMGQSMTSLVIAIGLPNIVGVANITRVSVMTVRSSDYVESARAIGLKEGRIIATHILPNCLSPILVRITLGMGSSIISASSLSFLGLGVPIPSPEWGALLSAGRGFIRGNSYLTLFPGLAIMITVLALNLLGDGLRDAMDPKLRR